MKSQYSSFQIVLIGVFLSASCVSAEERLQAKFDTLPRIDSTLLYDYGGVSSSATGDCSGSFRVHWYGIAMSTEDVIKFYSDYLTDNGWRVLPEEVVEIWSQDSDDGLYRMGVDVFTDPGAISQEQGSYKLPNSVLHKFVNYQTVYLLSMTYMYPSASKKCFGG